MRIERVNKFILDHFHNYDKNIFFGEYEGRIGVSDGFIIFFIDPKDFPFDTEKFSNVNNYDFGKVIGDANEYRPGKKTGALRYLDKGNAVEISRLSDTTRAWVNEKYLKYFDIDCCFVIKKYNAPVLVYEDSKLVGLIMPVRMKDEEV